MTTTASETPAQVAAIMGAGCWCEGKRVMGTRMRLPNRRAAESFELQASGLQFTCTVGPFPDGRLAEIFLTNHKAGSYADTAARDSAIPLRFSVLPAPAIRGDRRSERRPRNDRIWRSFSNA